jgi:hypothetical protein
MQLLEELNLIYARRISPVSRSKLEAHRLIYISQNQGQEERKACILLVKNGNRERKRPLLF